jgi:hypothetical protein
MLDVFRAEKSVRNIKRNTVYKLKCLETFTAVPLKMYAF